MFKRTMILTALLAVSACGEKAAAPASEKMAAPVAEMTAAPAAGQAEFDAAYRAAEAARAKAAAEEYEWNTTAPLLQKANQAAASGDFSKALALAQEAQKQGDLAYAQSQHEAANWQGAVVK